MVAVARKLLAVVCRVVTECVVDRKAEEEMVAFKLMSCAWKLGQGRRDGLTAPPFLGQA